MTESASASQMINQDSGDFEYYSPPSIVALSRLVMSGIDLDPASSAKANASIGARVFFNIDSDGLKQEWSGRVWMNHPFSKGEKACVKNCKKKKCQERGHCITEDIPGNSDWIIKLVAEFYAGKVEQACCITFASTSENWFRPLLQFKQCFIHGRTNYYLPDGTKKKGVTKGSVVTYMGDNVEKFIEVFSQIGTVK
jgi:hypothetical protein